MTDVYNLILRIIHDRRAQDIVEYALLAGFVAVAAGATIPGVANSVSTVFSKMVSVTSRASTT